MNIRLLGITLLVLLMIGGLVAGTFAQAIERVLTIPMHQHMGQKIPIAAKTTSVITTPSTGVAANILAQDMFQRANQPLWGTATDTRMWDGDANNANDQNIFSITNKMGQIANGHGAFNALLGQATSQAEVLMNGSINHFNAGAVNLGVVLRWQDTNNWYKMMIDGTNIVLLKRINGKSTILATAPFAAKGGRMYALRFRVVGATLFAKVWSSTLAEPANWMITVTDTDLSSGQMGIRVLLQQNSIVQITSFIAIVANSGM